jgi:hypothetical protein
MATLIVPKRGKPSPPSYGHLAALPDFRMPDAEPLLGDRPGQSFASRFAQTLLTSPAALPPTPAPVPSKPPAGYPANRPARLPSILAPLPLPPSSLTVSSPNFSPGSSRLASFPSVSDLVGPAEVEGAINRGPSPAITGDMTLDEAFHEVFTGAPDRVGPLEDRTVGGRGENQTQTQTHTDADPFGFLGGSNAGSAFSVRPPSPSLGAWLWAVGTGSGTDGSTTGSMTDASPPGTDPSKGWDHIG